MSLRLEHVSKQINTFCLKDILMELPDGYIMGLIGENGAGKTTLIRMIAGLYKKNQGRMFFDGMEYEQYEDAIKQKIGLVIHGDIFDGNKSLIRNANDYGRFYVNYTREIFLEYASRFQLDEKKKYRNLSKGEKLKFSLAFALAHKPNLLLLDEPTANFDRDFRKEFFALLREYTANGENSVILATHITSDIERVADYLLFLKDGKQLLYGDIEKIRKTYRMAAGEAYKIKLLKNKVIHMEQGEFGTKALVLKSGSLFDSSLRIWEPSIEELMYYMSKKGSAV